MELDELILVFKKSISFLTIENVSEVLLSLPGAIPAHTLFMRSDGRTQFRQGIGDIDEEDAIRVHIVDQYLIRAHRIKKTSCERSMYAMYNLFPAIWHNLLSRISREVYAMPLDELPLYINSDVKVVSSIIKKRFAEPWLFEEEFNAIKSSETASRKQSY